MYDNKRHLLPVFYFTTCPVCTLTIKPEGAVGIIIMPIMGDGSDGWKVRERESQSRPAYDRQYLSVLFRIKHSLRSLVSPVTPFQS